MPLVLVSGFPKEVKLLVSLRTYLNAAKLTTQYWITEVVDIRNSNMKEITIDFKSFNEALRAEEYINTVPYRSRNGRTYNLTAQITDPEAYEDSERYNRSRSREYSNERYGSSGYSNNRDRSRSPLEDPSKLDFEIELLRKKRLLIEEERRLLLEQKKLEMIKEFGVNACAEFDVCASREFGEGSSALFRSSAPRERERDGGQRERDRLRRPRRDEPPQKRALAHIPQFVLPCRIILTQMKKAMKQKAPVLHERTTLSKVIAATLRRRFAIVLENKSYMPSDAIAKLYREVYPLSTDEELIDKNLLDVKSCHWPIREKSQKTLDKIERRKAEKMKLKDILTGKDGGDKPGPSTDAVDASATSTAVEAVDVKAEPIDQNIDVKPDINTLEAVKVVTEDTPAPPQVKAELNATVTSAAEEPSAGSEEDWAENGVDWNDDDDESKDAQAEN